MRPSSNRVALLAALPALVILTACPSEPEAEPDQALAPTPTEGTVGTQESVLDEVEVMGVEEAAQKAEQEIDESNVLDALDDLEKEIDGN